MTLTFELLSFQFWILICIYYYELLLYKIYIKKKGLDMDTEKKIKNYLQFKLLTFKADNYNENTYNFSQGYRSCLEELVRDIDKIIKDK